MNRNVAIIAGVLGGVVAGYLVARSRAVAHPEASTVVVDVDAPKSSAMADVAEKCRTMNFREEKASGPQMLATGVVVRIIPADKSSKYKFKPAREGTHHREGAERRGLAPGRGWPSMDGKKHAGMSGQTTTTRLHSKFVNKNGTGEAPD
jgi:hypothetical protein